LVFLVDTEHAEEMNGEEIHEHADHEGEEEN